MSRTRKLVLVAAGLLVLLAGGRMVLRYLDYQAFEASRSAAAAA